MIAIMGLAYRAGSDPDDHPETWAVPEDMSLRWSFSVTEMPIGRAQLTRQPSGSIEVRAEIVDEMAHRLIGCPYLAVGLKLRLGGDRHGADLVTVSVGDRNVDPDLPPYRIVSIPDDLRHRGDILRDYQRVTVVKEARLKSVDPAHGMAFDVTDSAVEWHYAGASRRSTAFKLGFAKSERIVTDYLVAFIRARLDEEARDIGLIAGGGYAPPVWQFRDSRSRRWVELYGLVRLNNEPRGAEVNEGDFVGYITDGRLEHVHITRYDPDRMARAIDVKRRIVDDCEKIISRQPEPDSGRIAHGTPYISPAANLAFRTLRSLASEHDTHPDYRQEWAP